MLVLIPSKGEDILDEVDEKFLKSKFFILIDIEKDVWEIIENKYIHKDNASMLLADKLLKLHVNAIICQNIDDATFKMIKEKGIEIFKIDDIKVKEAINLYRKNELNKFFRNNNI